MKEDSPLERGIITKIKAIANPDYYLISDRVKVRELIPFIQKKKRKLS